MIAIAPGVICAPQKLPSLETFEEVGLIDAAILHRPVLVIEDEAVIAWTLQTMLEDLGFEQIHLSADGPDAVREAKRQEPGLVISDINLGDGKMNGVTACIEIAGGADLQIIFITGFASADDRSRIANELPRAILLRKPIAEPDLLRAIISATKLPH